MFFEEAKAKAKARLAWVADHPDYEGEGDKVIAALLNQLSEHEVAALAEIDRLLDEVEQLKADVAYLADRASNAGSCGGRTPRDVGSSSNAIVALVYEGKPVNALPADKWDYAACVLAVDKMPEHRKTPEVMAALDRAREAVRP